MEKKQILNILRRERYYLGKDASGNKIYLLAPSWNHNQYWEFGCIEQYTNDNDPERTPDIKRHRYFSPLLVEDSNYYNAFKKLIKSSTLTEDEILKLCDYIKTFYKLRERGEIARHGYMYYIERAQAERLTNKDIENKINHEVLPEIFEKVRSLFIETN